MILQSGVLQGLGLKAIVVLNLIQNLSNNSTHLDLNNNIIS